MVIILSEVGSSERMIPDLPLSQFYRNKFTLTAVENVFKYWYGVTTITESGMNYKTNETALPVDLEAKTITLVGDVPNISPTSYLHFFTFYKDTDSVVDQLCQR